MDISIWGSPTLTTFDAAPIGSLLTWRENAGHFLILKVNGGNNPGALMLNDAHAPLDAPSFYYPDNLGSRQLLLIGVPLLAKPAGAPLLSSTDPKKPGSLVVGSAPQGPIIHIQLNAGEWTAYSLVSGDYAEPSQYAPCYSAWDLVWRDGDVEHLIKRFGTTAAWEKLAG